MSLKRIHWFAFYDLRSPTVRYRGKYTTDTFRTSFGIRTFFAMPGYDPRSLWKFLVSYLAALLLPRRNALVVIQSVYSDFFYGRALRLLVRLRKRNTVYDLDDADYLRYPPATIRFFIRHCSMVTVGSHELLKNVSRWNPNTVLITCPVPDLNVVKGSRNEPLTLGWIGDFTKGHKESLLKDFFPALALLGAEVKLVMLGVEREEERKFLAEYLSGFPHVEAVMPGHTDWNDEKGLQKIISAFDLGIATLKDDEFNRSKSAFKLKQCLNNGVPVLSSDLPENNHFVRDGVNGYLCRSSDDFLVRMNEFLQMPEERYRQFSREARCCISQFDLHHFCREMTEAHAGKNR